MSRVFQHVQAAQVCLCLMHDAREQAAQSKAHAFSQPGELNKFIAQNGSYELTA